MPIYEYHCRHCDWRVEVLLRGSADEPRCPHCGGPLVEKLLSVAHVVSGRSARQPGHTCCGREERCDTSPCSAGEPCRRDG